MERDTPAGRGRLDGLRSGGAVREIACSFQDELGQLRGEIGGRARSRCRCAPWMVSAIHGPRICQGRCMGACFYEVSVGYFFFIHFAFVALVTLVTLVTSRSS